MNKFYKIEDFESVRCPIVNRPCAGEWCPAYEPQWTYAQSEEFRVAYSAACRAQNINGNMELHKQIAATVPITHFRCGMSTAIGQIADALHGIELNTNN